MAKLSIITDPVTKQQFSRDTDVAGSIYSAYTPPAATPPASSMPTAPTAAPIAAPVAAPISPANQIPPADLKSFQKANPGMAFDAEDFAHYNAAGAVADPKQLAAGANQEALGLYEQTKDQDIDIRDSQKIIRDLATKLTGDASTPPPKPPSMMEMFTQERAKLGLEPLESDLARIDTEIESINVGAFTDADRVGDQPLGMRAIGNKQGAISREAQRQVALLNVERSAVARQVDNKLATLKMVMDFTKEDYSNASESYTNEFNRNMTTLGLFMDIDESERTAESQSKQNATANLQTIWNSMKDSGTSFDTLDESQRRNINQMELQAGLPVGFYESLPSVVPEEKILSTTTRDVGGMKYADIVTRDPKTGKINVQSLPLGGVSTGSGGSGDTLQERQAFAASQFASAFVPGATMQDGTPILDSSGFVTPKAWKAAIDDAPNEGLTRASFIQQFGHLLYSKDKKVDPQYGITPAEHKLITGEL